MTQAGETIKDTVTITNKLGLHARPAMALVDVASRFQATVTLQLGDQSVDAKSIMQLMVLAAGQGAQIQVEASGPDASEAIAAIKELVAQKFDEEE